MEVDKVADMVADLEVDIKFHNFDQQSQTLRVYCLKGVSTHFSHRDAKSNTNSRDTFLAKKNSTKKA